MDSTSSSAESMSNRIAKYVCHHFNNLPKKGKPLPGEWTTLAAIIVQSTSSTNDETLEVISCATGTKCLGKSELSPSGDVVPDCHAEVLARRSFICYFYDQIELSLSGSKKSNFQNRRSEACNNSKIQQFFLKEGIKFHLFVSQLPCGDASIIADESPVVNQLKNENDYQPEAKKPKFEVINRTGAKLEVGPLVYEEIQSVGKCRVKPGKGDPTLCMSCSDKIYKWQLFGLQGSLLGNIIPEPIRLSSIVIGSSVPFSKTCLERAVFDRFENDFKKLKTDISPNSDLDVLFKSYFKPIVVQASINFSHHFNPDDTSKAPSPSSIIWHSTPFGLENVQVIVNGRKQGATKKQFGKPSAMVDVCRRMIFQRFLKLYPKCVVSDIVDDNDESLTYVKAKSLNELYHKCWIMAKTNVMLGWTTKPEPESLELN